MTSISFSSFHLPLFSVFAFLFAFLFIFLFNFFLFSFSLFAFNSLCFPFQFVLFLFPLTLFQFSLSIFAFLFIFLSIFFPLYFVQSFSFHFFGGISFSFFFYAFPIEFVEWASTSEPVLTVKCINFLVSIIEVYQLPCFHPRSVSTSAHVTAANVYQRFSSAKVSSVALPACFSLSS